MSRKIEVKCSNCSATNTFNEADLISGVPKKDINGKIVEEFPPVVVDENTFVACERCRYPMNCKHARVLN